MVKKLSFKEKYKTKPVTRINSSALNIFLKFFLCVFFTIVPPIYFSSIQAIPGNVFPSNNSREAPPPVDICVIASL